MTDPIGYLVLDCDGDEQKRNVTGEILFPSLDKAADFAKDCDEDYAPYTIHPVMPAVSTYPKQPEVRWAVMNTETGKPTLWNDEEDVWFDDEEVAKRLAHLLNTDGRRYRAVKLTIEEA